MKRYAIGLKQGAAAIGILMLLSGCAAGNKGTETDPFFDKWRAEAEATRGYSPKAHPSEEALPGEAVQPSRLRLQMMRGQA